MAASVGKFNMARLRSSCVFQEKLLRCLLTVCLLTRLTLADQQEFLEDFLKREYSLVKPYRGKFTVGRAAENLEPLQAH